MRSSREGLLLALSAALIACGPNDLDADALAHHEETEPSVDIGDEEHWVVMQSHLHTTGEHDCANDPLKAGVECYTPEGIEAFLDAALDYGASDMIITDHNNIDAWFDPAFAPKASEDGSRYATPLRGVEWSSGEGHMTLFFPREVVSDNQSAFDAGWLWAPGNHSDDPRPTEYADAIDLVHEQGGVVVINHPQLRIHPFDDATYGADAVEVGVKLKPVLQSTSATRLWWHQRLLSTDRVTAMAGSDHHHGGGDLPLIDEPIFGVAVNLIRVDPELPTYEHARDALEDPRGTIDLRSDIAADSIQRGHVMVIEDLHTPRVFIGADTDGDGRFHDARGGDCVPGSAVRDGRIRVRVRVTQADGESLKGHYNVLVYTHEDDDDPLFKVELDPYEGFDAGKRFEVDGDDAFAIELDVPVDAFEPGFVRVELEEDQFGPYNDTKTVTNPIYFGAWGDECRGSRRL
jgi:hypothetical protein